MVRLASRSYAHHASPPSIAASVDGLIFGSMSVRGAHATPTFYATKCPQPTGSACLGAEESQHSAWPQRSTCQMNKGSTSLPYRTI